MWSLSVWAEMYARPRVAKNGSEDKQRIAGATPAVGRSHGVIV